MSEASEAPVGPHRDGPGTILVVDDEPQVLSITELMLSQFGFDVLTAASGAEALRVHELHGRAVDLVLMDLSMPRLSGPEVFASMRAARSSTRVVFTSGYDESEAGSLLDQDGVCGYLQKPFDLERLLSTVRSAIAARRAGTEVQIERSPAGLAAD